MANEYNTISENINQAVEAFGFSHSTIEPLDSDSITSVQWDKSFTLIPGEIEVDTTNGSYTSTQYDVVHNFGLELHYSTTVSGIESTLVNVHNERMRVINNLVTSPPSGTKYVEWIGSSWDYLEEDKEYIADTNRLRVGYTITI